MRAQIVNVLANHGYSASPWLCRCGAHLFNGEVINHLADLLVETLQPKGSHHD